MTYTATSPVFAKARATAADFRSILSKHASPALPQSDAMFAALTASGIDPAVFLGQFLAESSYGTKGYARTTRSPGNIVISDPTQPHWTKAYGGKPWKASNGRTYASFPDWLSGTRAYVGLMRNYLERGWATSISVMASHWLGMADASRSGYVANIVSGANAVPHTGSVPVTPPPVPEPPGGSTVPSDNQEVQLEANVAIMKHYVDNLFAALEKPHLTAAKRAQLEANLAKDLDTLARNERALAAYRAEYHAPAVEAVDIGAAPIANNAQANTQTYACPPDFNADEFQARYGFSVQTALDKVVTGILRPNLERWQALVNSSGGTFTQENADYYKNGDVSRQKSVIAYFKGEVPFETGVAPYLGSWYQYLGCVDIDAVHDLGA